MSHDARLTLIRQWLHEILEGQAFTIDCASADASFRRYFRVRWPNQQAIVMDAPPEHEDSRPFVALSKAIRGMGLNAPEVLCTNLQQGLLLLSDMGDQSYLSALNPETSDTLYGDAITALLQLQSRNIGLTLPAYDATLLRAEMALFPEWFMGRLLAYPASAAEHQLLSETGTGLIDSALEQPQVTVHRDYHARNLMVTQAHNPGILDFQDAVHGPLSYDLVSLLRDCYIQWPDDKIQAWQDQYLYRAVEAGLITDITSETFARWFDWMGLQRHLKAIGIFARLQIRDHKQGYLADIPRTLGYLCQVSARYPELRDFYQFICKIREIAIKTLTDS